MNLRIEIPEDQAARFRKEAQARGLTLDRWLLELAEQNSPREAASGTGSFAALCAKVRELTEDLEITRDASISRDIVL